MKINDLIEVLKKLQVNEEEYNISLEVEPIIEEWFWFEKGKRYIKYRRTITIEDKNVIVEVLGDDKG